MIRKLAGHAVLWLIFAIVQVLKLIRIAFEVVRMPMAIAIILLARAQGALSQLAIELLSTRGK